jgi:NADPH-dependent 2,4-dienoyl-CoA reductase/sulfur reductase-like enzyme
MTAPYIVVGAGPTGLGCATELAAVHPVQLIDRIPVPGGEAGWSAPQINALVKDARRRGVRFRLGGTALRWEPGRLLVAGPGRIEWLPGERLFYAGGLRPATAADLFITGDRPAGILPTTVAHHLLAAQQRLWDRVAVIGDGPWASVVAEQARAAGTTVIAITKGCDPPPWADEVTTQAGRIVIVGRDRVSAVRVRAPQRWAVIPCDGVVLAAGPTPNRNVAGALRDDSQGVAFVQPDEPGSVAEHSEIGRRTARSWIAANGGAR